MHKKRDSFVKALILILLGGLFYVGIEVIYRGYSHWTMFLVGGLAFYLIGAINEYIEWDMPMVKQMAIGMVIITCLEFIVGFVVNIILGWQVWDYSQVPFNLLGQICLPFCVIWYFISAVAIIADDYIRYYLFGEEKPIYKLF